MIKKPSRDSLRQGKHKRIRRKVLGTSIKPRLCIYKSLSHTYAQLIDDEKSMTLVTASTLDKDVIGLTSKTNVEAARKVGGSIAVKAREKGITSVVFDRSGYKYHGRVAALADAAREEGLEF